jgi:hypothetical protein
MRRFFPLVWALVALLVISQLRSRLAERATRTTLGRDVYALPSAGQLRAMSLGYRAALADLLFANVLVSAGIHHQEKRPFEFVDKYLDAINALDPLFRDPYRYADTLLVVQATPVREATYFKTREVLRRGLATFPFDTELWESSGQFLAYLAPNHLRERADQDAFRLEGARDLARACELVSNNENIPYHCIGAARLLDASGEQAAARQFLRRVLAASDNPEIRESALSYLKYALHSGEGEQAAKYRDEFHRLWGGDLPFVTRAAELVLGPPFDPARCAGSQAFADERCASSWQRVSERLADSVEGTR